MGVMVVALEGRKKQYSGDTTQADWVRCPCVPAGVMVVTLPDYLIGFPGLLFSKDVGCKVLSGVVVMSTPVHRGAVAHAYRPLHIGPGCRRCQFPCGYGYVIIHTYIHMPTCEVGIGPTGSGVMFGLVSFPFAKVA